MIQCSRYAKLLRIKVYLCYEVQVPSNFLSADTVRKCKSNNKINHKGK